MKNFDQSVEINHNPNWLYILDHPYRILIIWDSRSGKTNVLLNLMENQQQDLDKFYLYVKDQFESKYQLLIIGREKVGIKKSKHPKSFAGYSQTIAYVYENLENYIPAKKRDVLIVFDDMIADMEANKKLSPICYLIVFKRNKTQHFTCFYITILFQSA